MAMSHLERSRRVTFLLLLEHTVSIAQLKNINTDWVNSILNHYLHCPSYLDKKLIPFYMEGFDTLFDKIMNRELFGSLANIYTEYLPYNTTKLDYPISYLHIPQISKSNLHIIKFNKNMPIKLRDNYDKLLYGFNAQYIYLIDINETYYIIEYVFKESLICNTLKYDFITNFCKANNIPYLESFIIFNEYNGKLSGIIGSKLEDGSFSNNKFIFKESE